MAPKAKAKVKAKAAAKAAAKGKAMAAPRVRRRPAAHVVLPPPQPRGILRRARGTLKRPGASPGIGMDQDALARWKAGDTIQGHQLGLEHYLTEGALVVEKGSYYQQPCRIAGILKGVSMSGNMPMLRMKPEGTDSEAILATQSGQPQMEFRIHVCGEGCNGEVVHDDIIHAEKVRKHRGEGEEGWTSNLKQQVPTRDADDLALLRERERALPPGRRETGEGTEKDEDTESKKGRKKKKKKDKDEKKKKKKKEKKRKKEEDSSTTESVALDGSKARAASMKKPADLFGGTGLDPKERTRVRVARKARHYL